MPQDKPKISDPLKRYADSAAIGQLIAAIMAVFFPPVAIVGAALGAGVEVVVDRVKKQRIAYLIDRLENGDRELGEIGTIHLAEPIVQAAYATIEATTRTSRREKISAFARLFKLGILPHPRIDFTIEFEDYLKILDDLSLREIQILYTRSTFEKTYLPGNDDTQQDPFETIFSYWDAYKAKLTAELQINGDEIDGLLMRLSRSGCYEPLYATSYGGPIDTVEKTTGTFKRLEELIGNNPSDFNVGHIVP